MPHTQRRKSRRALALERSEARYRVYFLEFTGVIDAAEARRELAAIDRRYPA